MRSRILLSSATLLLCAFSFSLLHAADSVVPGNLTSPYPTLTNLAFEWELSGDDNLNCTATLEYRQAGAATWREGLPLRRIPAGRSIDTDPIFYWKNKLSGSLFGLRPGTQYEVRIRLSDPDGGAQESSLTVGTRRVPCAPADSVVKSATPATFAATVGSAQPGDVIVLAPGGYGAGTLLLIGTEEKPITLRGSRADTAAAVFSSINLRGCKYLILDNVTVSNPTSSRPAVDLGSTEGVAVRYCRINSVYGITADNEKRPARNCYVADNTVLSSVPWTEASLGAEGDNVGEGIELTGPGNVICYNYVSGYRDCISTMEDGSVNNQFCIDIYNNDIRVGTDDAVEADFCQGNCRIMDNRITNCFMGLSSQPGLGGPTYFIRNVMYNIIDCPFKLARYSKGDVVLHNTVVKVGSGLRVIHNPTYAYFRNNLALGGRGGGDFGLYGSGDGRAVEFDNADSTCDLDYDGVGSYEYQNGFLAKVDGLRAWSIGELNASFWEKHAVQVGLDVFAATPDWPSPPFPERAPADLRLAPGSVAVDHGQRLPGVNDDFTGGAPDLGAYELGQPLPHYGPRALGVDEATSRSGRRCDFSGDGRASVMDVLAMLLAARRDPSDPSLDLDGDGAFSLEDARLLARDILSGACGDSPATALAATGMDDFSAALSPEERGWLSESVRGLGLGDEVAGILLAALDGGLKSADLPRVFALEQNYPNPFNPSTVISFSVPEGNRERVSLEVYDLRGRLVRRLVDSERDSGVYSVFWDGTDATGQRLPSGVYFYRLRAGSFSQTRKMVLLK
ncbi:T9SS type A sorting domain-containing protein [bacterium]|nr:T9SS type A sorting domain-containing protein [bacterium]